VSGIPDEIKAIAEFAPVEDLMLAILREKLPGVRLQSQIEDDQTFPFIMVRRSPTFGQYNGDMRFTDWAEVAVNVLVQDPNGDEDAAVLSEAVRVALRDAAVEQKVYPGLGHVFGVTLASSPRRAADWSTATGPVQYADLPTGVWRYEARYEVEIRKPSTRPYPLTPTP
jgi:hypothetical protein